jgi:hypothetical protein
MHMFSIHEYFMSFFVKTVKFLNVILKALNSWAFLEFVNIVQILEFEGILSQDFFPNSWTF